MAITVLTPARKHLLSDKGSKLTLGDVLEQVRLRWQSVVGICLAFAFQAMCNYAQQAWLPTYFLRTHGWKLRQAGLTLGVISLGTGLQGAYFGGSL